MSAWLPCPDPPPSAPDDYFTCQLDNCYCLWLAAKTTMLCCDKGVNSTCAVMATINCDLQLQNATTYPASRLKSTALDSDLQQCGWKGLCCPFGYTCDDLRSSGMEPLCGINLDQDHAPTKASTTSLPPATLAPATVVSTATVLPGETGYVNPRPLPHPRRHMHFLTNLPSQLNFQPIQCLRCSEQPAIDR